MKLAAQSKMELIQAEGVFHSRRGNKYVVRVLIKNTYRSIMSFKKQKDADEYYLSWLKENR